MNRDISLDNGCTELRSFGRKRGRKISAKQQALLRDVLPCVSVDLGKPAPCDLSALFAVKPDADSLPFVGRANGGAPLTPAVLPSPPPDLPHQAGGMVMPDKPPTDSLPLVGRAREGRIPTVLESPPPYEAGGTRGIAGNAHAPREVWLEIGFGGAEHMIAQARANPRVGVIGCEPFEEGVVKALAAVAGEGLGNVRIHADDARPLLRWLPAASLARVFILFPDPWPKKRHHKRRLFSATVLDEIARVMRPSGELRFATDWGDYARHALYAAATQKGFSWTAATPADWRQRPPDWPQTRYETKAIAAGRPCYFFRFIRQAAE